MRSDDFETVIDVDGVPRKILRDKHVVRVPLMLRDGINPSLTALQRSVANRRQLSDQELASCRPGFRYGARTVDRQALFDAKAKAYQHYDAELSQAYLRPEGFGRDPRITGAGSHSAIGPREGDVCQVKGPEFAASFGQPGHLRMRNGALVCVPDRDDAAATKARLRARIDPDEDDDDAETTADRRSTAQIAADHKRSMAQIYDELDQELRESYRNVKP
jgi:hypothetical protein